MERNIHMEKVVHQVWLEWKSMPHEIMKDPIIGKYQYIFTNEKGQEISLVELPNYFRDGVTFWEIYCLEGDLFEDIERFGTFDEAMEASKKYLNSY